ncbi:hypothetical protein DSO57_1030242 [Entomophthora muscae]|uniref:Uncharacterized protein n=1 Tax=Entomophthora muscae TaxID=34485 RepID=A0ACC2SQ49_9FUNG|nr:hypothetical protein DSO57_1030242 [Entomophthora muscae]
MFRSNRLGCASISRRPFKEGALDFKLTNALNKPGNIILRTRNSFIRTLTSQAEECDSESRIESFLKRGIDPYPNFQFLSAGNLDASSSSNISPPSSGYNADTLREVQQKLLDDELSKTNSLPFNDLATLKARFSSLEPGARLKDTTMVLAGRILSRRDASAKLVFYDIMIEHNKVQVMASLGNYSKASCDKSFVDAHSGLRRGDIVRLVGFVGKSKAGELSIFATSAPQLLAPCLPVLPLATQLGSLEQRFRRRPLALLLHDPTIKAVKIRAKVLQGIRRYLDARGFLEVETPILAVQAGGAAARPFTTNCRALDAPLHLRISPELYLKQMVVGGFDRVYELGRVFRNESIDPSHNPEFTTCEFYLAYANLETLFQITEELLGELVQGSIGSLSVKTPDGVISFQAPFSRIHVVDELTRQLGPLPAFDGPGIEISLVFNN